MKKINWIMLAACGLVLFIAAHSFVAWCGIKLSNKIGGWFPWIAGWALMAFGLYHVIQHIRGKGHGHSHLFGGHAHEGGQVERGPHNGFLVNLGHGFVEITIFETDVPPRFRLFFHDKHKQARSVPANAIVKVETVRPDDTHQTFAFHAKAEYLESTTEIPEPHEFRAIVKVSHGSHTHTPHEVHFSDHDQAYHAQGISRLSVKLAKNDLRMTKDPICGMTVDETTAIRAEHDGETFYFCSEHCRKKFIGQTQPAKTIPLTLSSKKNVCIKLIATSLLFMWILASRADETTSRVNAIRIPAAGQVMKAQLGTEGTIHLLFQTAHGPQYAKSEDSGLTFSAPITIVNGAAQKPGLEFHAEDLAVGKDGRVYVAMSNNAWKLKLPEEEWGLYYTSLAPGAKAFKPVRNLNLKPSEGFSLAADKGGRVTACFLSGKLFAKVSRDNGETFTANAELNPAWDPCDCCTTSAAYGPDGKLAVLYREEINNERDMYVVLWDQNLGTKPSRTRISGTPWKLDGCPMTYFTIRGTDTGYVAAWPTKGQVYFARLDKDGAVLPPGEIRTPGTTGMRTGLDALGAKDGATLVAWKNKDLLGWQLYDAKGQSQEKPESASSLGTGAAGVVLPNGKFILFL